MVQEGKKDLNVEDSEQENQYPEETVVIPIVNSPIFPGMIAPIVLTENKFTPELERHLLKTGYLALNLVKHNLQEEDDEKDDEGDLANEVYSVGVLCKVVKKIKMPDGTVNILVHGMTRYRAESFRTEKSLTLVKLEIFPDIMEEDEELDAYARSVINHVKKLSEINPYFNEEMKLAMLNSPSPSILVDLVAFALSLDIPETQDFIETMVVKKRFAKLLIYLNREQNVADLQKKISDEVSHKVNKYQREYYLREQLKVIRNELGLDEDERAKDLKKFKEGIKKAQMNPEAEKVALEELKRLESIPDSSPEYNVARTYLNWMIDLPWSNSTESEIKIAEATKVLERDHFGLEKPKKRILEFLAVRKIKPRYDGTILCLAGPPGVGKTSLGKSIAEAMGRKFYRFSLGGMRDEAEIKGHRRTYIGAMPGRLLQALKRVEVNNPVIMLDEIDKLGNSFQGDPASALLEVLDPEQNSSFIDHYLDVPFDLSKVMFIATANYLDDIPEALLDRMEVIELSGYTLEEKLSIATKWVIPKQRKKHGLKASEFKLMKTTLKKLIADYAREPGVRVMEQCIAKLCRHHALEKVNHPRRRKGFNPEPKDLEGILGGARFETEKAFSKMLPGEVLGLAWTAYGGALLYVESLPLDGKGFKLTGQLGDVMNESASIAYTYVRGLLQQQEKKRATFSSKEKSEDGHDFFAHHEVHLHLPAGATPKDGPSAGITMALALYSLATNKRVKKGIAMTGELSLKGRVLPVGGIKEKVLAAKRAGVHKIILPASNEKDLKDVPQRHRKGMTFYPVKDFQEVLKITL